ncbi:alginate lyase family protein [Petrimonas sp.]|uniref:alginate lyase family protein n=1 Tax=Petrimonas sp. TaxID=2023866 RepID=UPI003F50E157
MRILCFLLLFFLLVSCHKDDMFKKQASDFLEDKIMADAQWALTQEPETITSFQSERSEGGIHDFYSEGDYWWPNPDNPDGPYIRNDGETNPDNFVAHRLSMIRFSKIVGYLASAYILTQDESYVEHAFKHIKAWFVDSSTYMNPNLLYAQAIKGVASGRGIGIIDTIHLMEVAQGIYRMQNASCVNEEDLSKIKQWFNDYIHWLTTHPYGVSEINAKNNHGTCWVMQVASFAKLTDNSEVVNLCRERYKKILLPDQMAENGSFPLEINRTKPYGYSLFNLDAMVTICQILSTPENNLWEDATSTGLNIRKGIDFMYPYIKDKNQWPYEKDVMYWEEWPIAQPALIFSAIYYKNQAQFDLWKSLSHTIVNQEVDRNCPIRNPLIWI